VNNAPTVRNDNPFFVSAVVLLASVGFYTLAVAGADCHCELQASLRSVGVLFSGISSRG
jgi:hypothetical protein